MQNYFLPLSRQEKSDSRRSPRNMTGKATKHFVVLGLALLGLACLGFFVIGNATRFDPEQWIQQHGAVAEAYALSTLRGEVTSLPASLSEHKVESGANWVSFGILVGPFYSHGLAYAPTGQKPKHGLGGEPEIKKWQPVKENWHYWVAD
jgi:hypothetical protein